MELIEDKDEHPCIHRGLPIRMEPCMVCGFRNKVANIYSCALHEECSIRRYIRGQKVRTCNTCTDRKCH